MTAPEVSPSVPRALAYLRVSTGEQERSGVSLGIQRATCRQYVGAAGWEPGQEYLDVMRGDRSDRPRYQAMLAEVRRLRAGGRDAVVVVASLERLGRQLLESVRCREELKALGVPLHSVRDGGVVPDLVAHILAAVAQDEVQRRWDRMLAATRQVVAGGWYPPCVCPWGYRRRLATAEERAEGAPRAVLEPDPTAAPRVRELFARALAGESQRRLAAWVAAQPAGTRAGLRLSAPTIGRVLHNLAYVARMGRGDPRVLERPRGRWPALVDEATWARLQDRIAGPLARSRSGAYLLSGFLRCPGCGRSAGKGRRHRPGVPDRPIYRCEGHGRCGAVFGPVEWFDRPVLRRVRRMLTGVLQTAGPLEDVWDEARRPSARAQRRGRRAEATAARARRRLARAGELLASGDLDPGGYELVRDAARADLEEAARALAEVARERPIRPLPPLAAVIDRARAWRQALAAGGVGEQREVLAELVERVEVERLRRGVHRVEIAWTVLGRALRDAPARARRRAGRTSR